MSTRSSSALIVAVFLPAMSCTSERTLEIRFETAALRLSVNEVRAFVYDVTKHPNLSCEALSPIGQPPFDTPARVGVDPEFSSIGKRQDILAMFENVPADVHRVVLEGWQRRSDQTPTLRGFACTTLDFSVSASSEGSLTISPVAEPGSIMSTPSIDMNNSPVSRFDEENPLYLATGVTARDPFFVQLVDPDGLNVSGGAVHFRVTSGDALLSVDGVTTSSVTLTTDEDGRAQVTLAANASPRETARGTIIVEAHAAGYEGSPMLFSARTVPSVAARVQSIEVDPEFAALDEVHTSHNPVIVGDIDGDGYVDVFTSFGIGRHRLLSLHGQPDGSFRIRRSRPREGTVLDMIFAQDGATKTIVTAVSNTERPSSFQPRIETWRPTRAPGGWTVTSSTTSPWPTVSLAAGDLDSDGVDEIAAIRCENWAYNCITLAITTPDNQVNVLSRTPDGWAIRKVIEGPPLRGGFREAVFTDLDRDGSVDLLTTTVQWVYGFCGNRVADDFGFEQSFFRNITLGQGGPLAVGRFNDDLLPDVVSIGAFRSSGPRAGLRLTPGCSRCVVGVSTCGLSEGPEPVLLGRRSLRTQQAMGVHDLNDDGLDDILNLHRDERILYTFMQAADERLARGPDFVLAARSLSSMGTAKQGEEVIAAMTSPLENRVLIVRMR